MARRRMLGTNVNGRSIGKHSGLRDLRVDRYWPVKDGDFGFHEGFRVGREKYFSRIFLSAHEEKVLTINEAKI